MPNNVIFNDDGSGGELIMGAKQRIKDSLNKDFESNAKKIEDETTITSIKIKVETNVKSNLD